ncbi:membrane-bound O-acyltransferase family protein [Vibrio kasasachensis]|uniref:MBOAT family O-acyltransferase n=1 Tax=Vibrio kasasachensis TaxID=2910248 RepID=UPI003D0C5A32
MLAQFIAKALVSGCGKSAKRWLIIAVFGNLSTLAYFKYADFGINSLNSLLNSIDAAPLPLANVILPIGISFYIFQAISYVIDVYRKDVPVTERLVDFAAFIALFPQLIAGPVLRYKDIADQFSSREHNFKIFSEGVLLFMIGFAKKVLIADSVSSLADAGFALSEPSFIDAWLSALAYSIQLYFDFSGYSDMACGLGLMMGFRFVQNFNKPYVSLSITEFWRRWHISLSTWLRDYLYIPLGGSRGGSLLTYRNLLLTMLLGGLWHGANWTFVFWGALHGTALAIERLTGWATSTNKLLLRYSVTMLIVIVGWISFRAENMSQALGYYQVMFDLTQLSSISLQLEMSARSLFFLIIGVAYILWENIDQRGKNFRLPVLQPLKPILIAGLFGLAISKLIASAYSPFLYFQF